MSRYGVEVGLRFKVIDRDTQYLFPPSVQERLPEKHLARFVVDIVEGLNLERLNASYRGSGSKAFPPSMMVAFRYIAANTHPDHDTIASFRKSFLEELSPRHLQGYWRWCKRWGCCRWGR